ncbi:DUF1080 domain-containing protein [Pontibacter diazotrophicus]|uniref:DUF1080 domain-containing protein n=1 Tax=Pontibacter diazotrophicus TaxID=1400979 RepID=A0A3D8LIN7_9BACT|nr:DUF1080 domain-containing protein [Pontibacter diazotrophicus]RDV17285.1 DUF1080 domain-containing protein [Pontibacter diazotrophicus]
MKIKALLGTGLLGACLLSCTTQNNQTQDETVAQDENVSQEEWVQLFNGKDLDDWDIKIRGHALNENYGNTFRVEDGNMVVRYDQYEDFDKQYGHIFYKEPFSSYLLVMEYRFVGDQAPGGEGWALRNSGAMLHSQPANTMGLDQDFPISLEAQLLGGNGQDERSTANLCTPGTNVVMGDSLFTPHCISSSSETYHGDQWVRVEALVLGDSIVKHIVEGDTVMVYQKPQIGGGSVSNYDPAVKQDGQLLKEGYISLQSESHPVEFRKVELFNLEQYMDDPQKLKSVLSDLQKRQSH